MITTKPLSMREHRPDGINIFDAIFRDMAALREENKALREALLAHEERLNNLTLNIPDATLNAIVARTLDMHAQVLLAAIRPQSAPQTMVQEAVEPLVELEEAPQETTV
ncbi:MAG TPA: hypothetical protein VKR06_46210 [Ktedonosporobacter sp.]|nr:hypothetical protein [Ktedonosporobacter sp.]